MKKEKIYVKEERRKPRVPTEGQDRLRQGGVHRDKKKYHREQNRVNPEDVGANTRDNPGVFCSALTPV